VPSTASILRGNAASMTVIGALKLLESIAQPLLVDSRIVDKIWIEFWRTVERSRAERAKRWKLD